MPLDLDNIIYLLLAVLILVIGLLIFGYWKLFKQESGPEQWQFTAQKKLKEIDSEGISGKYLVIELDKLLEYCIKSKSRKADSFGSILKTWGKKRLPKKDLDEIWRAHRVRSMLVHDHENTPEATEINKAIITLKRYIKFFSEN